MWRVIRGSRAWRPQRYASSRGGGSAARSARFMQPRLDSRFACPLKQLRRVRTGSAHRVPGLGGPRMKSARQSRLSIETPEGWCFPSSPRRRLRARWPRRWTRRQSGSPVTSSPSCASCSIRSVPTSPVQHRIGARAPVRDARFGADCAGQVQFAAGAAASGRPFAQSGDAGSGRTGGPRGDETRRLRSVGAHRALWRTGGVFPVAGGVPGRGGGKSHGRAVREERAESDIRCAVRWPEREWWRGFRERGFTRNLRGRCPGVGVFVPLAGKLRRGPMRGVDTISDYRRLAG